MCKMVFLHLWGGGAGDITTFCPKNHKKISKIQKYFELYQVLMYNVLISTNFTIFQDAKLKT